MKIIRNLSLIALFTLAVVTSFYSCKKDKTTVDLLGNWIELAVFAGDARSEAVAFSIGEIGYVGTGYNGRQRLKDFWAYDANMNNWYQIASDPEFAPRAGAVAFSVAGKGYVGTGYDNLNEMTDFWSYDPGANQWTRVADIPAERRGAVAFTINDIGYVGTGYDGGDLTDFYSYNPSTDSWTQIVNCPVKVSEAVAFMLDNKGYVCTGIRNGVHISDFHMYDPETGIWVKKRSISNVSSESYDDDYTITRQRAVAFTIGNKAYITTGDMSGLKSDVWEYDPGSDLWIEKTIFEGSPRHSAVAFSTASGRGFVTTGLSGSSAYFDDLFEFKPFETYNEGD